MATVAVAAITRDGVVETPASASGGGDKVKAGTRTFVTVHNGSGGSVTLTVTVPGQTSYGVTQPVKTFAVAAGATRNIPILPEYGDPDDGGLASLSWSATTTVTFSAWRI